MTLIPPNDWPLPGAVVSVARTGSPASSLMASFSGESAFHIFFCGRGEIMVCIRQTVVARHDDVAVSGGVAGKVHIEFFVHPYQLLHPVRRRADHPDHAILIQRHEA